MRREATLIKLTRLIEGLFSVSLRQVRHALQPDFA